jgi:hypothetical protein
MLLAMVGHLAEGLDLNDLLTLKSEKSLTNLESTRILTVCIIDWQLILLLKHNNNNNNNYYYFNNNSNSFPLNSLIWIVASTATDVSPHLGGRSAGSYLHDYKM